MAKYKPYQLRLPPEHIDRMTQIAEDLDIPTAQVYRLAVKEYIHRLTPVTTPMDRPRTVEQPNTFKSGGVIPGRQVRMPKPDVQPIFRGKDKL